MHRPDPNDPYAAFAPSLPAPSRWQKARKLAKGMVLFSAALVLSGLLFWGLFMAFGPEADVEGENLARGQDAGQSITDQKPDQQLQLPQQAISQEPLGTQDAPPPPKKLQGPDAGQVVAPPSRNVTPNFQLSPLHQAKPLTRAIGKALPPPPKLPPLPQIFRKVGILGPHRLVLMTKLRSQSVSLSHVSVPDSKALCSFGGQKIACYKMGKTALSRFIRGRAVGCLGLKDTQERDRQIKSQQAQCFLGSGLKKRLTGDEAARVTDLAAWMVRYGWVIPDEGHYQDELAEAKRLKRGLYAPEPSMEELAALRQLQAESDALAQEIEATAAATVKEGETVPLGEDGLSLFTGDALSPDQVSVPVLP